MGIYKIFYNEKNLISFIRYGAMLLVLCLSFIITILFIENTKKRLQNDSKFIEKKYIEHNKIIVQNLVNKFYQLLIIEKKFARENLDKRIKEQIYQAHAIATAIYKTNKKKPNYSKEQTIEEIKTALKNMRFNSKLGYMFIYQLDGLNILNAEFPSIQGQNLWNYRDAKGVFLLQEMKKILSQKDETFYEWHWKKDKDDNKEYKKRGYFKKFEPYNLFIGTGDYIQEFEKTIKQEVIAKINSFEFREPEHIFMYNLDGLCLSNPKKELIGKNRIDAKNSDGRYVLREVLDFSSKNKEGFIHYKSSVNYIKSLKSNEKISFVKLYKEWGWVIGSGFYLEEMEQILQDREKQIAKVNQETINKIIIYSSIITIIILIISFYLSKAIFDIFYQYKLKQKKQMKESIKKEKLLAQQSKMATMGEMIGNIAHQWKQPLGLISMSNGILKLKEEEELEVDKEAIVTAISNIDNSIEYLSNTIDDFRNFFRPDKEKKYFYLDDIFNKTYKLIETQFKNNNIKIIKDIENLKFYTYENEFLQVLINLLKNAKDELVKLNKKEKKLLFVKSYIKGDFAIIELKDNAGGIANNIIDKVFEPYFTTKKDDEGTGIGLFMSKQLIEGMDGKILVENESYKYEDIQYTGAKFSILLPLKGDKDE